MRIFLAGLVVGIALGAGAMLLVNRAPPERPGPGSERPSPRPTVVVGPPPVRRSLEPPVESEPTAGPGRTPPGTDAELLAELERVSQSVGSAPVRELVARIRKRAGVTIPSAIAFQLLAQGCEQAARETVPAWSDPDLLRGLEQVLEDPELIRRHWSSAVAFEMEKRGLVDGDLVTRLAAHEFARVRVTAMQLAPDRDPPPWNLMEKLAREDPAEEVRLEAIWALAGLMDEGRGSAEVLERVIRDRVSDPAHEVAQAAGSVLPALGRRGPEVARELVEQETLPDHAKILLIRTVAMCVDISHEGHEDWFEFVRWASRAASSENVRRVALSCSGRLPR